MMFRNFDQSTIDLYLFPQLFLLDILYPILLALFLSTLIIRLSNLIKVNQNHVFSSLFILPFIAMFIDYFENIMVSLMITNVSSEVIKTASLFTQMKGGFTTLSCLAILTLLGLWLINKRKKNKNTVNTVYK